MGTAPSTYPHRIFIGYDPSEDESARVLKHSIERRATEPVEVRFLVLKELQELWGYKGGENTKEARPASTEFTYTRFLVPWLCGYKGKALFMDCDIACIGDVTPVFNSYLGCADAICCVQHVFTPTTDSKMNDKPQKGYFRKLWSSVMLLNCENLRLWSKDVVEDESPQFLHGFEEIPDRAITELPYRFNEIDSPKENTVLFHYTEFNPIHNPGVHPHEDIYRRELEAARSAGVIT